MAPVIDDARAAREAAAELRLQATGLRFSTRLGMRRAHEAMAEARHQSARVATSCSEPLPSPWSGLLWRQPDETLDRTLVLR